MAKRNNIPAKVRNDFVTKQAYSLLNTMGFISLPINPFEIVECFGWKAYTVEEAEAYGVKCPFNLDEDKPAINFLVPATGDRFIIYYGEKYSPRLYWSMAHEIGHIMLEHKCEFPYKLTDDEYAVAEIEAHLFAAELLAPTRVVASDMFPKSINEIASLCNISPDAASKKTEMFTGARKMNAIGIMTREGEELYRNMYNYLLDISNYWNGRLKETDITLPPQYEDFIFCDYLEYVKNRMKREHKALFNLIDNSIAFYDNADMVLFVANDEAARIDITQKNSIIESLAKYANSPIRNIVAVQFVA